MSARSRLLLCLAIVAGLFCFHVHLKTAKIFANPTWSATDEVGQFWSESAFHYRFAKFFAEHPVSDWGQLSHDRSVQYPDTIDDWAEFTVAMEVPVGVLYRWFQPATPFHVFVVWYDCIVSSLTLFGVFFMARALWRSDLAGVFASALYASLYPSYGRTVKNLFLREDFAIPLIVFALFFTVRALQEQRTRDQVCAALFWLAALASWHLTQFVMAPLVVAAMVVYLGKGEMPRLPWLVLVMAAGSVLIPVLRAKQVYLSPTMCALYALALAVWIDGGRKKATMVFAGWLAAFLVVATLLGKSYGEYAHVYQLFFYKLRYLGVKSPDPSRLPWEARSLWEGAFNTAERTEWWRSLQWCLPLSLVAMWFAWREKNVALRVVGVFTLLLFPLAWMVMRYFTFLGFAAAIVAAGSRRWLVVPALVWQIASLNFQPLDRGSPEPASYVAVVNWLRENTPTNAVVLAQISESPVLLAHTGRPIIMHSKFENARIRERYREMLDAIYGSEDQFYAFARKYEADYFVYDTGYLMAEKDSRRYKANRMGELDLNCVAMLFAEHPEKLQHFEPVNGPPGIFRVLR